MPLAREHQRRSAGNIPRDLHPGDRRRLCAGGLRRKSRQRAGKQDDRYAAAETPSAGAVPDSVRRRTRGSAAASI